LSGGAGAAGGISIHDQRFYYHTKQNKKETMSGVAHIIPSSSSSSVSAPSSDQILESLKIISVMKPGQKLAAVPGQPLGITIQDTSSGWLTQALCRLWYGDGRDKTLRLLHVIFDHAFAAMEAHLGGAGNNGNPTSLTPLQQFRGAKMVERLTEAVRVALRGVTALEETYATDINHSCKLSLLAEKTLMRLEEVKYWSAAAVTDPVIE